MDSKLAGERPDSRLDQLANFLGSGQPDAVFPLAGPNNAKALLRFFTLVPGDGYVHIHGDSKGSFAECVRRIATDDDLATRIGYFSLHNHSPRICNALTGTSFPLAPGPSRRSPRDTRAASPLGRLRKAAASPMSCGGCPSNVNPKGPPNWRSLIRTNSASSAV